MAEITNITKEFVLGTDGVTYFQVVTTDYDNEEQTVRKDLIGTADVLTQAYADDFKNTAASLAVNAEPVSRARRDLNTVNKANTDIEAITGIAPTSNILAEHQDELLTAGWTFDDGTEVDLVFTVNAGGTLKYSIDGAPNETCRFYADVFQLRNYPTNGEHMEFFLDSNRKKYYNLANREIIIKKP